MICKSRVLRSPANRKAFLSHSTYPITVYYMYYIQKFHKDFFSSHNLYHMY